MTAILLLVFCAFSPVLKADFVQWDDDVHVLNNHTIKSLNQDYIREIFTSTVNDIYIPLTTLSFAIEYKFFGLNPFVYHLTNLLLHLGIILFVYLIARQMGVSVLAASLGALLFGLHPMHVESVAWVTERKDVLYGIFYVAAVWSYLKYLNSASINTSYVNKKRYLILTTILGLLSILAKPMALSLPLILFLLDWFHGRRFDRKLIVEKIPVALLIGGVVWITYSSFARIPGKEVAESFLIWPWTLAFYLRQFVFPFFSVPIYRLPEPIVFSNLEYTFSLLLTGALFFSLWVLRKHKWIIFSLLFFFFSIFFLLRFDASHDTNIVADRFMYLPSLGFCILAGLAIHHLTEKLKKRKFRLGFMVCVMICVFTILGVKTFQQTQIWNDSRTLWQHQLKYFPQEKIALNNLATVLRDETEYIDAVKEYKKILNVKAGGEDVVLSALAIRKLAQVEELVGYYSRALKTDPEFTDAHYNLGSLHKEMGNIPLALASYQKIIDIDPMYKDVYMGVGDIFRDMGDAKNAVDAYRETVKIHPESEDVYFNVLAALNEALEKDPENIYYNQARRELFADYTKLVKGSDSSSLFNLGNMFVQMKEYERAVSAYQNALDINPRHAGILYNLGNLYKDMGSLREALDAYGKALKVNKHNVEIYKNMGVVYGRLNQFDKAIDSYKEAIAISLADDQIYFNLAYAQEMMGQLGEAAESYRQSIQLNPDQAEAYYNLGNLYVRLKKNERAQASYQQAITLDPNHLDATINLSIASYQMKDFKNAVKYCDDAILLGYNVPEEYRKALAPYR